MKAKFTLKCVGCGMVERRDAEQCRDQPFCNKCYMPMTVTDVSGSLRTPAKRKAGRK